MIIWLMFYLCNEYFYLSCSTEDMKICQKVDGHSTDVTHAFSMALNIDGNLRFMIEALL
jgi:hypothetical protein